jgi:nitrate reductase delta subunit
LNKSVGFTRKHLPDGAIAERVRTWTRARFALGDDATVMAAEVDCAVPGCPPLETVVAFWIAGVRHHFKVFKPLGEVVEDDLPPSWLKGALVDIPGVGCDCC